MTSLTGALIIGGFLYVIAAYWCGLAMYENMKWAADRRDHRLRESRRYGTEHNYSVRMRNEAKADHRNVQGWAVALILSPLWPVHAIIWLAMRTYDFAYGFFTTLKWKG